MCSRHLPDELSLIRPMAKLPDPTCPFQLSHRRDQIRTSEPICCREDTEITFPDPCFLFRAAPRSQNHRTTDDYLRGAETAAPGDGQHAPRRLAQLTCNRPHIRIAHRAPPCLHCLLQLPYLAHTSHKKNTSTHIEVSKRNLAFTLQGCSYT